MNGPINRTTAVIFTYVMIVVIFVGILTVGIPPVISQFKKMIISLTGFLNTLNIDGGADKYLTEAVTQLGVISGGVVSVTLSLFQNITTIFTLILISVVPLRSIL